MKAIGKNIVIERIDEQVKTESGLLLSADDTKEFRYQKGRVILPGTEVVHIHPGDVVYYDTRQAYTIVVEGDQVTIIQEGAIVVLLESPHSS